jgi:hypothetical protein
VGPDRPTEPPPFDPARYALESETYLIADGLALFEGWQRQALPERGIYKVPFRFVLGDRALDPVNLVRRARRPVRWHTACFSHALTLPASFRLDVKPEIHSTRVARERR